MYSFRDEDAAADVHRGDRRRTDFFTGACQYPSERENENSELNEAPYKKIKGRAQYNIPVPLSASYLRNASCRNGYSSSYFMPTDGTCEQQGNRAVLSICFNARGGSSEAESEQNVGTKKRPEVYKGGASSKVILWVKLDVKEFIMK